MKNILRIPLSFLRARVARTGCVAGLLTAALVAGPPAASGQEPAPSWRFDFGTPTSQVAAGYSKVTPESVYSQQTGHGWLPGNQPVNAVARGAGGVLEHDANLSRGATFRVDVPNDFYAVEALVGDTVPHDPMTIAVEGGALAELQPPPLGTWTTLSKTIRVEDGHIDVTLITSPRPNSDADPDALINALVIQQVSVPPDPVSWSPGRGRTLYRKATVTELTRNGWPLGTSLVVNRDLRSFDDRAIRVFVPTDRRGGVSRRLRFAGREPEIPVVEIGFGVRSVDRRVSFRRYEKRMRRRPAFMVLADEETGAFWGRVEVPGDVQGPLELRSGEPSWQIDPVALPDGLVPEPVDLYGVFPGQTSPGPGDKVATPSGDAFGFALVGEIKWCTANRNGWATALAGRALHVREGFQACPEQSCPASTDVTMEQRGLYCNMASSQAVAANCALGTCPTNDKGHDYSYLGCRRTATCYMDNVEANLLQARGEGHTVREIDVAQVVHDGLVEVVIEGIPDSTVISICGMASFPAGVDGYGEKDPVGRGGTSVAAAAAPDDCSLSTSTHEFGHNYGAIHERDNPTFVGAGCADTVMAWGPGKCNVFSIANALTLSDCSETNNLTLNFGGTLYQPGLGQVERRDCPMVDEEPLIPAP
jgi:hypothetical protein